MKQEGQLPTFTEGKIYLLDGSVLNELKKAIIKEIEFGGKKATFPRPNVAKIEGGDGIDGVTMAKFLPGGAYEIYRDCTIFGTLGEKVT